MILEGSGRGLIEVLTQHLPKGAGENCKIFSQDIQCLGRDIRNTSLERYRYAYPLGITISNPG